MAIPIGGFDSSNVESSSFTKKVSSGFISLQNKQHKFLTQIACVLRKGEFFRFCGKITIEFKDKSELIDLVRT